MVRLLARIVGVGVETADMLVHEVLSRPMRDRRAVARYAGLTGAPDESGAQRREQGLARAGNARIPHGSCVDGPRLARIFSRVGNCGGRLRSCVRPVVAAGGRRP
jgi:transposase